MALGSVAVSGGMSKKEKERMMYMDGKLVWSTAIGGSDGMSATAPAEVDYIVVKPMDFAFTSTSAENRRPYSQQKTARVARGGSGYVSWVQSQDSYVTSRSTDYARVTFSSEGKISISCPQRYNRDYGTIEGYHYC